MDGTVSRASSQPSPDAPLPGLQAGRVADAPGFRVGLLILIALVVLALGPVLGNGFTWLDDDWTIHQNPRFAPVSLTGLLWYWTHADHAIFVPLTNMVWALLAWIGRRPQADAEGIALAPTVFHAASLGVHLVNACLAYLLLGKLLRGWWAAFFGAAVFALHPLQVESVAWASGLKDLLAGLFVLLYLHAFLGTPLAHEADGAGQRSWWRIFGQRWYWKLAALLFAGMLAKPSMMMAPAIALCILPLVRPVRWRELPGLLGALMLPAVPLMVFAASSQPAPWAAQVPVYLRPLVGLDALAFYVWKVVWPTALSVDYGRRPALVIGQGWIYYTWLLPVGCLVMALVVRRGRPWWWAGILVFAAAVAPVSGLKPFDFQLYSTVTDHYVYVAMLGVALIVGGELTVLLTSNSRRTSALAAAGVIVLLAGASLVQVRQWRSDRALWQHSVTVNPQGVLAQMNLGAALIRESRGNLPQALGCYQEAVRLDPKNLPARESLASALLLLGRLEEAVPQVQAMIELEGTIPGEDPREERANAAGTRSLLGQVLLRLGRPGEAAPLFRAALELDPGNAVAQRGLAASSQPAVRPE